MPASSRSSLARTIVLGVAMMATAALEARAIEMFTYFGDGSRIGLPSLEVPIEAYPGIPLRSDRLRARRRALRMAPAAPPVQRGPSQTITIRAMPEAVMAPPGRAASPATETSQTPARPNAATPVAPEPEEVSPPEAP